LIQFHLQSRPALSRSAALTFAAIVAFAGSAAQAAGVVWTQKDDFVRIEPADGATPNPNGNHVPTMSADAVRKVLAAIRIRGDGGETEFLTESQIDEIAAPVADGLRSAGPNEDVAFAVHYSGSIMSIIGPPKMTSGRIFLDGDAVGVILGMVQEKYQANWIITDPTLIHTGSRVKSQQTNYSIQPGNFVGLAVQGRGDWARVSPAVWTGVYSAQQQMMPAPMAPAQAMAPAPAYAAPAAAAPAYAPAAAPAMAAPVADTPPAIPASLEERFAILKRLYDNKMITEAEYEKSKSQLLQGLTGLPSR